MTVFNQKVAEGDNTLLKKFHKAEKPCCSYLITREELLEHIFLPSSIWFTVNQDGQKHQRTILSNELDAKGEINAMFFPENSFPRKFGLDLPKGRYQLHHHDSDTVAVTHEDWDTYMYLTQPDLTSNVINRLMA